MNRQTAAAEQRSPAPPLVAHVIFRLSVGGLENGLVNLINHMPPERYRHAIVCLAGADEYAGRIRRPDVQVVSLDKKDGKDPAVHLRAWRLFRRLKPDLVHTRNLAALETAVPAVLAGVRGTVHGEHGLDVHDLDLRSRRYERLRRAMRFCIGHYIPLSLELEAYLLDRVRVPANRITRIYNGVDQRLFRPSAGVREPLPAPGFERPGLTVLGTVGRMKTVKDQGTLARAFVRLLDLVPDGRSRLRLAMVGGGPLVEEVRSVLGEAGAESLAWLPGDRDDVPRLLRGLDVFVLPSLAEGISNGILEAMSSGLPVVATAVGGNPELVIEGETGHMVPRGDPEALAEALLRYVMDPEMARRHGRSGRAVVQRRFSMERMVDRYMAVYDHVLGRPGAGRRRSAANGGVDGVTHVRHRRLS